MQNLVQQLTSKLKELSPATMRLRRFDGSVVHFEPGKGTVEQDGVRTQTEHPLQGYKFNPDILAWTQYSAATSTTSEPLLTSRECELSVLTWNVWFDPENLAIRAKTLVDEAVTTTNASILCFQEATDTFIQILSENPVIRSKYWVSHTIPGPNSLPWPFYTCVVAVSLDHIMQIVKWARIEVPSTMGRSLWMLEVKIPSKSLSSSQTHLRLITSHFESLDHGLTNRKLQRSIAKAVLLENLDPETHYHFIVCGDCNTTEDSEEKAFERLGFRDAWREVKDQGRLADGQENGYTIGITYPSTQYKAMRFDRVLTLPSTVSAGDGVVAEAKLQPKEYRELGRAPISEMTDSKGRRVFPSDHLGVMVFFRVE